jgi:hypothetical protein
MEKTFAEESIDGEIDAPLAMPVTAWLSLFMAIIGSVSIGAIDMAVLPLVAIVLGLIALRPGRDVHPVGRFVACCGLVLGTLFLAASVSEDWLLKRHLVRHAEQKGLDWLTVLGAGEIEYATELANARGGRQIVGADLVKHYEGLHDEAAAIYQTVTGHVANGRVLPPGERPSWKRVGPAKVSRNYAVHTVDLTYEDQNQVVKNQVSLSLKREFDEYTRNFEWHVAVR